VAERSVTRFIKAAEEYGQQHRDITVVAIQRDFLVDFYLADDILSELSNRGYAERIKSN
jgi:hypothetical protein